MNRRDFLKYSTALCASVALGNTQSFANLHDSEKRCGFPMGMLLIDAHAHPEIFPCNPAPGFCDQASTINKIKKIGMNASCFAVIGDFQSETACSPYFFNDVINNLNRVITWADQGEIKLVRETEDIPDYAPYAEFIPGAILALEGAVPLVQPEYNGGNLPDLDEVFERVDYLLDLGVRIITLMHYCSNELGSAMTDPSPPDAGNLTETGRKLVEQLMSVGIIVDVAHSHRETLRGIAEIARTNGVPIIDSHTSLIHSTPAFPTRRRPIEEMEWIADTGGVVCTWPVQGPGRTTFSDWAREIQEIAGAIGIEHVGLGTDGGGIGNLAPVINGYQSILDLPKLVEAMDGVGLKRRDIALYMGKNFRRVMKKCVRFGS